MLRTMAQAELAGVDRARLQAWTDGFLRLWARVYRPEQKTLLKATEFAARSGRG